MRTIALDTDTAHVLRAHRQQQLQERLAMGQAWTNTDFVFTQPDGNHLHPQHVSDQFLWLAHLAGLPPIRLHDLRHGAASLMLAAGVEMKVVQETLGHTSSAFTADTYVRARTEHDDVPPRRIRMPRMTSIMEGWVQSSCRRELLDQCLLWNERQPRHALLEYEECYHQHRTHRGLEQAAPLRAVPAGAAVLRPHTRWT